MERRLVVLFASLVLVGCVGAAEYYVSPTGTASWSDCTNINTPCSLQTANQNAQAGDVVYLRPNVGQRGHCQGLCWNGYRDNPLGI